MASKPTSSVISLIVACHIVLLAVLGTIMNTSIAIHDLGLGVEETTTSHHHHFAITHVDYKKSEVTHHHSADNFQPVGLPAISPASRQLLCQSTFCDSEGPYLLYIHPDGLLRPPRDLL